MTFEAPNGLTATLRVDKDGHPYNTKAFGKNYVYNYNKRKFTRKPVGDTCDYQKACCFVAGTKVKMKDSSQKNIEEIKIGDMVMSWNETTKDINNSKVVKLLDPIHSDIIKLNFGDTIIENTSDHPYYVKGKGWCSYNPELTMERYDFWEYQNTGKINKLEEKDICYKYENGDLKEIILDNIKETPRETKTYIIKLEKDHTFFANNVLTHNK